MSKAAIISTLAVLGAAGAVLAAVSVGSKRQPQFDQHFRPAREQSFAANAITSGDCSKLPHRNDQPSICIGKLDKQIYRKGEALNAQISWQNVPAGSSVIISIERDTEDSGARYVGPAGALHLRPIPVAGSGAVAFHWNGQEFPCAPTDFPTLCKAQVEIGRYRLHVALYDREQIAIVGWPSPENPVLLGQSMSPSFVVQGQPNLQSVARAMWWAGVNQAMGAQEIDSSSALQGDMNGRGLAIYETAFGSLCADLPAALPYISTLTACVPKKAVLGDAGLLFVEPDVIQVTGHVAVKTGAISRKEAIDLARQVADIPYRRRVAFTRQPNPRDAGYDYGRDGDFYAWSERHPAATTYLSDSVSETIYRPDLGGAWVIVVNEIMAGGSLPEKQRFADKVLVLVQSNRKACVIETAPYKGKPFKRDPNTITGC